MTTNWIDASPWGAATLPDDQLQRLIVDERAGRLGPLLPFWGHAPKPGPLGPWVLSQWWDEHPFELRGISFATCEHAMMYAKAVVFRDADTAARILEVRSPKEAKALGREVRGYDDAHWKPVRYDVVIRANRAKFSQHEDLRTHLLSTAPATLVEASPYDRIWGVGLGPTDSKVQTPSTWRGQNLLGFALTQVRDELLLT